MKTSVCLLQQGSHHIRRPTKVAEASAWTIALNTGACLPSEPGWCFKFYQADFPVQLGNTSTSHILSDITGKVGCLTAEITRATPQHVTPKLLSRFCRQSLQQLYPALYPGSRFSIVHGSRTRADWTWIPPSS